MEVTILGRGKSLEKLEDFKTDYDKVILVNEFEDPIETLLADRIREEEAIVRVPKGHQRFLEGSSMSRSRSFS